jgi:hypothetical protein
MSPQTKVKLFRLALLPLTAALIATAGCTSSTTTGTQNSATAGPAFLIGTDQPLASVVSFQAQFESAELTGSGGNTGMLSGTPTVDFARYNGLQTLVDMNDVQDGTYTGVTFTLGAISLGYLNVPTCTPTPCTPAAPTITTLNASSTPSVTLSSTTVSVMLDKPLVIQHGTQPVGVRMDFDLRKSIPVDSNGNLVVTGGTITITPTIDVRTVARQDTGAYIDELVGAVVALPSTSSPNSFGIQGPHGEQFTINTTPSGAGETEWDGGLSLSTLSTNDIVQVSGPLDPADQTMDADEVAVISDKNFYATGQITYVTPATGAATSFDLYVRALEPTGVPISLGQIAQVNLTGSEKYYVYWMHNKFTNFFFNSSALVAGQAVAIGGPDTGVVSESSVAVDRIHLRNWGFNGTITGSQNSGNGSFQMQVNGFAGVLIPETVTVYLGGACDFRYGLGAFGDLTNGTNIRVVGLLLKDPAGNVVLLARHVDGLDFTDFTTAAWE